MLVHCQTMPNCVMKQIGSAECEDGGCYFPGFIAFFKDITVDGL